jgi:hypothetical protein
MKKKPEPGQIPQVGDIWRSPYGQTCLLIGTEFDEEANTNRFVVLDLETNQKRYPLYIHVKQLWTYLS